MMVLIIPDGKWRGNIEDYLDFVQKQLEEVKSAIPIIQSKLADAHAALEGARWLELTDLVWEINGLMEGLPSK